MKKKFHSIKNRLFIILLALSLGSLVLMSGFAFYSMNEIEDNAMNIMVNKHEDMLIMMADKQAKITKEIITRTEQSIITITESINWNEENDSTIATVLQSMKNNNPYIYNSFIALTDGSVRFYSKNPELKLNDDYNPLVKSWYNNAVNTEELQWSKVYKGSLSGELMITCSKVIYAQDSSIAGVIGVDLTIDAINEKIIGTDDETLGYTFLIDGEGNLIAHPEYEATDSRWDDIISVPLGMPMSTVEDENFRTIMKQCVEQKRGFARWKRNANSKYIAFETVTEQNWTLGLVLSEEFIQREIKQSFTQQFIAVTRYFILMLILVTMIVVYVGLKMSQRITKPIEVLNSGAKKIGAGDLDYNIEVKTNDELENLADGFNKMSTDLQHYITDLEETTKQKQKMESELSIASRIQQDMLPLIFPPFPDKPEIDLYASMLAAKQVGGDFYDFFLVNPDKLCFVIGDVSGKGIPASLFMVISKTLIKSEAMSGISPAEILDRVNKTLIEGNDEMMFVTVLLCMLDLKTGELTFANGGHNPPLPRPPGQEPLRLPLPRELPHRPLQG